MKNIGHNMKNNILADSKSRTIYKCLKKMENTYLKSPYIREIVMSSREAELLKEFSDDEVYIYGAGINGLKCNGILRPMVRAFIDGDERKQGKICDGLPVISIQDMKKGVPCVISPDGDAGKTIKELLLNEGVKEECIITFDEISEKKGDKYFDKEIISYKKDEVYIDVGAFNGDTIKRFIDIWDDYKKIYACEPIDENAKKIRKLGVSNIEILKKAFWEESLSSFGINELGEEKELSWVCEEGISNIATTTLDKEFASNPVSFIKINVNGYEHLVINGGKMVLSSQKPKLSLAVHPNFCGIDELIDSILEGNRNYNFILRHYGLSEEGTVLYAV